MSFWRRRDRLLVAPFALGQLHACLMADQERRSAKQSQPKASGITVRIVSKDH